MKTDAIKLWLARKLKWGFAQSELFGVIGLLAGVFVLFLTFWLTYAIIWFGWDGIIAVIELVFNKRLSALPEKALLIGSGIFVVLLFVQYFWTNPSHWGDYPRRDYLSRDSIKMQAAVNYATGIGSLLMYPGASANIIADILLTGPRLVAGAIRLMRQGFRIWNVDENACSEVLCILLARPHTVPYDELKAAGWEPFFDQLRCIEGVEFLEKGLLVSDDLRNELNQSPAA